MSGLLGMEAKRTCAAIVHPLPQHILTTFQVTPEYNVHGAT
jgi:hypothetical protein